MNTYIFTISINGPVITESVVITAPTRVCAMEIFAEQGYNPADILKIDVHSI